MWWWLRHRNPNPDIKKLNFPVAQCLSHSLSSPQPLPVQRREHDGRREPGHRVRPHPPAHAGHARPGGLSGARERGHQNRHPEPRQHLPRHQGAAGAGLWEVYDRRPVLVRRCRTSLKIVLFWSFLHCRSDSVAVICTSTTTLQTELLKVHSARSECC